MFLFLHGLALALGFLMGLEGGSGFSHVSGGGGMISAPMDSGGGMPPVTPGDSGGGMPPGNGQGGG